MNRPIIAKQGKSKRGVWTKEQRDYTDRCVSAGCIACIVGRQIHESPSNWHHTRENYRGTGMRCPHEFGLALCPSDHWLVHHRPRDFEVLVGMSEAELVKVSQRMFRWQG
jgi:hypothetical protein